MSMRDWAAGVLSLKKTVPLRLTLMSVAKPWMLASPAPLTSHCEEGLPGRQFSASMALAGEAQEAMAACVRESRRKVHERKTIAEALHAVFPFPTPAPAPRRAEPLNRSSRRIGLGLTSSLA